jgi:excisionase family DNA binding protein
MSIARQESDTGKVPSYLVPQEVADLLRLSVKSVYRVAANNPDMPMLKIGGSVRFPRERLERWLRDREQGRPRMQRQVLSIANPPAGKEPASA